MTSDPIYDDGFYFYSETSLGPFHIENWYDAFHADRKTNVRDVKAESRRLLESGRSCLTIQCQGTTEYVLHYPEDMGKEELKKLVLEAIGNHPLPEGEPVVWHDDRIIWDPFTDPYLREIYTHLTGNQV